MNEIELTEQTLKEVRELREVIKIRKQLLSSASDVSELIKEIASLREELAETVRRCEYAEGKLFGEPVWVDEWIMLPAETEARITIILDSASSRKKSIAAGGWKHFVLQWVHVEKEDEYRKTLDKAIEKMKKKAEIRHELPAAIDVVGCGQEVYKPCPHGVQAKVGSGYCTHYCSHRAEAEQWGKKVYCWYPEYRRRQPLPLTNHQILQGRDE